MTNDCFFVDVAAIKLDFLENVRQLGAILPFVLNAIRLAPVLLLQVSVHWDHRFWAPEVQVEVWSR